MSVESSTSRSVFYVFIDESGDFNFSPNGSRYFILTALSAVRPFLWEDHLAALRYDLIEDGLDIEYFHASEDRQQVRDHVFSVIGQHLTALRLDSVIMEKRKTLPALQQMGPFYGRMLGYLIRYVVAAIAPPNAHIVVVTDRIPVQGKRRAIEKITKTTLATMLPSGASYQVLHHESKSCGSLQVVDYCNWATYRKWKHDDRRSYNLIAPAVQSESDIFHSGPQTLY